MSSAGCWPMALLQVALACSSLFCLLLRRALHLGFTTSVMDSNCYVLCLAFVGDDLLVLPWLIIHCFVLLHVLPRDRGWYLTKSCVYVACSCFPAHGSAKGGVNEESCRRSCVRSRRSFAKCLSDHHWEDPIMVWCSLVRDDHLLVAEHLSLIHI